MKKILLALTAVVCMASFSFAQDKKSKAKMVTPAVKPVAATKITPATKPAPAVAAKPAATAGKMKADGTPDMRYKQNKDAAKAVGPLKKDGTPDMRYKQNKAAAKKKG